MKLLIDWPDCTPKQAQNFMEKRRGSLKDLDTLEKALFRTGMKWGQ
jgi:hypothetical protein